MKSNLQMPKNKAQLEEMIINAFMAGCTHGYAVEHTTDIYKQEHIGALKYIGKITEEEYNQRMYDLRGFY